MTSSSTYSRFYNCCGASIYSAFGYDGGYAFENPHGETTKTGRKRILDRLKYHMDIMRGDGMGVIILNELQVKRGVEQVVLDAGFKKVFGPCFHPGHRRDIFLYAFEHHPRKRISEEEKTQTESGRDSMGRFAKKSS